MDLDSKEIYKILKSKEVKGLYHANTVRTSKTFLENKSLLSRKYVDDNNLRQTEQKSDEIDKKFNIYDDLFFDALNISAYFSKYNIYGPILFKLSLEILNQKIDTVRITKKNPIYWKDGEDDEKRYYQRIDEFKDQFKIGNKLNDGGNHIMITTLNGRLPLDENLEGIQIDNPGINYVEENGLEKPIYQGILQFYENDLKALGIEQDKIIIKDHWLLKWQYKILYQINKTEFFRLFGRKLN